jgi:GNAT superfamily N-acetyltransferase
MSKVIVENPPAIPGLNFRDFRGADDFPVIQTIAVASDLADGDEDIATVEDIANIYSHLSNCNPYEDMLFVEVNGKPVAYSRVFWKEEENNGKIQYYPMGKVVPEYRHKGLGTALLRANMKRIKEISSQHPSAGKKSMMQFVNQKSISYVTMLEKEGFSAVRYNFTMCRPDLENIPDHPLPAGLEVRPVKQEHIRIIWDAMVVAFRDHWGTTIPSEEDYQEFTADRNFRPDLWQVAWEGDRVVGTVIPFIDAVENEKFHRLRGWTEEITTQREWRKKGVAHALLVNALHRLKAEGMKEAALHVDSENPTGALSVYTSVGFQPIETTIIYQKPIE